MNAPVDSIRTARGRLATPVGTITVLATDRGVRRVGWDRPDPDARWTDGPETDSADGPAADIAAAAGDQLREYFGGSRTSFDLPLDLAGLGGATLAVLIALKDTVGHGETVTYGELAARSDSAVPARAIGSIMGSNPIPLVIPCHRVVAADGLGGYSGGEPGRGRATKIWLLEHEGALPPALI